jgi:hypothetical protein
MKIWLDDERPMPEDEYDLHVRESAEAIKLLKTNKVTKISLDWDLGPYGNGMTVAEFIRDSAKNGSLNRLKCFVHTGHPSAFLEMSKLLIEADQYWKEHESKH